MLVDKVAKFMIELGAGFSYVGKGLTIDVGGDEFEIDLLFYHVVLHRYIVIELKTGNFHPKDLGQLGFYMTAVDRQVKSEIDGKTIGILLCKSRNDIVAVYSLADLNRPIGVSTYRLGLPPLEQLQAQLRKLLTERKKGGRSREPKSLLNNNLHTCRHNCDCSQISIVHKCHHCHQYK